MASENAKAAAARKCMICGFSRALDRCHIYPSRIIKVMINFPGFNKSAKLGYKGRHIMILCKNCHWLFDHFLLEKEEFDKIRYVVGNGLIELREVLTSYANNSIIPNGFMNKFNKWNEKLTDVIQKFYGNS